MSRFEFQFIDLVGFGDEPQWSRAHTTDGPCDGCCCGVSVCEDCGGRLHQAPVNHENIWVHKHATYCEREQADEVGLRVPTRAAAPAAR
ncbi:hypothetical protein [Streptomyces sp. DW26H14]|uniref:hypothetical protein n=1 Tax=Streptomyces sp. DW26H14 TaxID=3435395 RepID=UPI00403E11B4